MVKGLRFQDTVTARLTAARGGVLQVMFGALVAVMLGVVGARSAAAVPAMVAAGVSHSMMVLEDGTLWAWGWNDYGQLGDGTFANKSTPTQVGSATNWTSVATGYYHTVAIKSDGTLWAWGITLTASSEMGPLSTSQRRPR